MMLSLVRTENTEDGVFGRLAIPGADGNEPLILETVEDDWRDNLKGQSCIPPGTYTLRRTIFYRHGYETFEVTGVPNRARILLHIGNTEEDLEGCIGLGMRRGTLLVPDEDAPGHPMTEKRAVVASREAFRRFMERMKDTDDATLTVRWAPGLP